MQPIEGMTPDILWYTLIGVVAFANLYLLWEKIRESFRKRSNDTQLEQDKSEEAIAEKVSRKVIESLEPRFNSIEEKLQKDKNRLESHEVAISNIMAIQKDNADGFAATCQALIAVLDHELHDGNNDQMEKAKADLHDYLIHRPGK